MGSAVRLLMITGLLTFAVASCDNDYPLPPTACDDWCFASQRANCQEDWPEKCVSGCEFESRFGSRCDEAWQSRYECYRSASTSDFFCSNGFSRIRQGLCDDEEQAWAYCAFPVPSRCGESCEAWRERCPDVELSSCWEDCARVPYACEATAVEFLDCASDEQPTCSAESVYDTPACDTERSELILCLQQMRPDSG